MLFNTILPALDVRAWYSVPVASQYLGVTARRLRNMCVAGEIKARPEPYGVNGKVRYKIHGSIIADKLHTMGVAA